MHGTRAEAQALLLATVQGTQSLRHTEVAVCPPAILIPLAAERLAGSAIRWGGQNLSTYKIGAYTGEISGIMLKDFGCTYVIVGHSERRSMYGEDDRTVAQKFQRAQEAELVPILCVGETLAERDAGKTEAVVTRQIEAVLTTVGIARFADAVLAYEPVWAIGTGRNATPEQAQAVHDFIRRRLAREDRKIAAALRILYGGSVKAGNAPALFAQADVDGGLIGGASLNAEEFTQICRAAEMKG